MGRNCEHAFGVHRFRGVDRTRAGDVFAQRLWDESRLYRGIRGVFHVTRVVNSPEFDELVRAARCNRVDARHLVRSWNESCCKFFLPVL